MGDLCAKLFELYPQVTLYVNDTNLPALRLYKNLGFRHHCAYRTIFVT